MPAVSGAPGSRIREEGSLLPLRPELNFIGGLVTATDNPSAGRTDITVTGDGAGSGTYPGTVFTATGGDDTAALQAILDGFETAGGGELIIDGMCRVSGLRYDGGNLTIRGVSGAGSQWYSGTYLTNGDGFINTTSSTTTLDFSHNTASNSDGAANTQGCMIENLRFTASSVMTGGWAIKAGTSFSCSTIRNCTFHGRLYSIYDGTPQNGHYNGVYIGMGAQEIHLHENFFWYMRGPALELEGYHGSTTDGTGTTYLVTGGMMFWCEVGLRYKHKDAVRVTNVDFVLNLTNVQIQSDSGSTYGNSAIMGWAVFTGCIFDGGMVNVVGGASNTIQHIHFIGCHFLAGGLSITGPSVSNIKVDGCTFSDAGVISINSGAAHTSVTGCSFETPYLAAITVASGVCDFIVTGNNVFSGASPCAMVKFTGSNDRFVITGNMVRASSGAVVTSGTSGASNYVLANNLAVNA